MSGLSKCSMPPPAQLWAFFELFARRVTGSVPNAARYCTVSAGGLTKGYDVDDNEWIDRANQMAQEWALESDCGRRGIVLFVEGDKPRAGSFTQVVVHAIERFRYMYPAAIIRLVVTLSDAAEWPIPANPSPDDWSGFGVPVAAVIVFNASCLAAVMTDKEAREIYKQCWGDLLYGESDAEGVEGPRIHSTGSYFMLAFLTLHFRHYLSREHGFTMCQKKFLLTDQMSDQIRRDVLSPRQPDEHGRFPHVAGGVTFAEMLYDSTVPFYCSRCDKEILANSPDRPFRLCPTCEESDCVCNNCGATEDEDDPHETCMFGRVCPKCAGVELWAEC